MSTTRWRTPITNRREKDRKKRKAMRVSLRAEGMNEHLIDQIIEQQRHADLVARQGSDKARIIEAAEARHRDRLWSDDTGFKPTPGDPLLRGAARVQGVAAKVVQRRDTITRFQYEREVDQT